MHTVKACRTVKAHRLKQLHKRRQGQISWGGRYEKQISTREAETSYEIPSSDENETSLYAPINLAVETLSNVNEERISPEYAYLEGDHPPLEVTSPGGDYPYPVDYLLYHDSANLVKKGAPLSKEENDVLLEKLDEELSALLPQWPPKGGSRMTHKHNKHNKHQKYKHLVSSNRRSNRSSLMHKRNKRSAYKHNYGMSVSKKKYKQPHTRKRKYIKH